MQCEHEETCLNSALCSLCDGDNFKKLPQKPKKKKLGGSNRKGSNFEKKTQKQYDNTVKRARPTINSGSLWFDKLDLDFDLIRSEAKDTGVINAKGEKQLTIKKEWLEDAIKETPSNQIPALNFQFKNDDEIYCTMRFDDVIEMIVKIKELEKMLDDKNGD